MDVLESKLRVPRVPGGAVRRDHLLNRMAPDGEPGHSVTVISAPAGAGKTVLLAEWTARLREAGTPVAWLSIDSDENDPRALWSGLLAASIRAVRDRHPSVGSVLTSLSPPGDGSAAAFVDAWFAAIDSLPRGLGLVLDDVHKLGSVPVLGVLARLLENVPPGLAVLIGCRYVPAPLAGAMSGSAATTLDGPDLAFDREEAMALLHGHGVELGSDDLAALLDRTEGWAAALRLAALSLERRSDKSEYIAAIAGDDRPIAEYLLSEVLSALPPDVMTFLRVTSVPAWLTEDLAEQLSGRHDAASILDRLAEANALVFRNDSSPPSYRYHPLLRDYLRADLDRQDASAQRKIQVDVSDWFGSRGNPRAALAHATEAEDWIRVGEIVGRHGLTMVLAGDRSILTWALARYPVRADVPDAGFVAAIAALTDGDLATGSHCLDLLGRDVSGHRDARLRALHTTAVLVEARLRGDRSSQIVALARHGGVDDVDDGDLELAVAAARGMLLSELGEFSAGESLLTQALGLAHRRSRDLIALDCLSHLTMSAAGLSHFEATRSRAEEALEFAARRGWASSPQMVPTYLMAAWAAWHTMDVEAAERFAAQCIDADVDLEPTIDLSVQFLQAHIQFEMRGDLRELRDRLQVIWADTHTASMVNPVAVSSYCLQDVRVALSARRDDWAREVVGRSHELIGGTPDAGVIEALMLAHEGRMEASREALGPVVTAEQGCFNASAEIGAWLLEAHLAIVNDEPARASHAVARAVAMAAPLPSIRDLASASAEVVALLRESEGTFGVDGDFVAAALRVIDNREAGEEG